MVDTSDQWIFERTGIRERHIAAIDQAASDLALHASRQALKMANLDAKDIQAIIFATATPDSTLPQAACILQAKLGATNAFAFDLGAACSGFVYAMSVADSLIKAQGLKHILVVGAETLSRVVDYQDRETCILFGDGAGALILSKSEKASSFPLSARLASDGTLGDLLTLGSGRPMDPFALSKTKELDFIEMKGKEVFKSAVRAITQTSQTALEKAGLTISDVDWFIPHQANLRIMAAAAEMMGLDVARVACTIEDTGNTSSASIPIVFSRYFNDGRIKRGDKILISAFGAGLTSGAAVFEF